MVLIILFPDANVCEGAVTLSSTWIGEAKKVEMKTVFCPNDNVYQQQRRDVLEQRQTNPIDVCGAPCRLFFFKAHNFLVENLYSLFQAPRTVSRHQEVAPTQMTAMSSPTLFVKTVKA
jgi:hypothetical protein